MKNVLLILFFPIFASAIEVPSPSGALVDEIMTQNKSDPHRYDWRDDMLTFEAGYGNVSELNSFKSTAYTLGVSSTMGSGWLARFAARRVVTHGSSSSDKFALTPYSQSGQPSRYEFLAGGGYALLDGRSQTALSPRLTDLNHALYLMLGVQYNYFTSHEDEPVAGMHPVYYNWVIETGLRWHIFLPHSFGVGFEWAYSFPMSGHEPDLGSWQRFGGLLTWSFSSAP